MFRVLGGGLNFSSPLKKKDSRVTARAFSTVVWLLGLPLIVFIGFNVFNYPWSSIDWLAVGTWLKIGELFLGLGFLLTPVLLFWAISRIVAQRNKRRYGWAIAIFSTLLSGVALAVWLWLIFRSFRHKYV